MGLLRIWSSGRCAIKQCTCTNTVTACGTRGVENRKIHPEHTPEFMLKFFETCSATTGCAVSCHHHQEVLLSSGGTARSCGTAASSQLNQTPKMFVLEQFTVTDLSKQGNHHRCHRL
mmetsp:Transcript_26096/g.36570  ORF Transcript_26096/g.36570 Transcript_26096/m.36570 type:complete len:117 (-) Transcript_26096:22-372(-)